MRLVDLDPRWIMKDGARIGFTFVSPGEPSFRQSCFCDPPSTGEQVGLFEAAHGDDVVQPCKPSAHWQIAGGIESASFETMTVKPSLDGSSAGLWHGHITDGKIVGGLS